MLWRMDRPAATFFDQKFLDGSNNKQLNKMCFSTETISLRRNYLRLAETTAGPNRSRSSRTVDNLSLKYTAKELETILEKARQQGWTVVFYVLRFAIDSDEQFIKTTT